MAVPYSREFRLETKSSASIECRIIQSHKSGDISQVLNIAIVAHPYGPLGGTQDDSTVQLVVDALLTAGHDVVGTFNFRRPSWTLKPEVEDYSALAAFLMHYVYYTSWPAVPSGVNLLFAGYSYGSFVASHVPPWERLNEKMSVQDHSTLRRQASELAAQIRPALDRSSSTIPAGIEVRSRYLLVSPLLSPAINLLAPFNRKEYHLGKSADSNETYTALAIFGTDDVFTSSQRLAAWAANAGVETKIIQGAGHFWQDAQHRERLERNVREWLTDA